MISMVGGSLVSTPPATRAENANIQRITDLHISNLASLKNPYETWDMVMCKYGQADKSHRSHRSFSISPARCYTASSLAGNIGSPNEYHEQSAEPKPTFSIASLTRRAAYAGRARCLLPPAAVEAQPGSIRAAQPPHP